ncbi:uncharacterized protein [Diadema antillarum]|uniref:uncharacterized protein n=1 Tax=Diadema antillarum TaxID=105358 RepID=UPI003A83FB0A
MLLSAPGQTPPDPQIKIEGTTMNTVESFAYLGSCLSSNCSMDKEVCKRLAKAGAPFDRLWTRLWVNKASDFPSGWQSTPLTSLRSMAVRRGLCLRRIIGISWQGRVSRTEVLRRAKTPGIEAVIVKAHLRWVGHVVRMDDAKMISFSELASGVRNIGRPLKRYKDSLKTSLDACGISALLLLLRAKHVAASARPPMGSAPTSGVTDVTAEPGRLSLFLYR